jgi:RNA polymerase primary sigma factor
LLRQPVQSLNLPIVRREAEVTRPLIANPSQSPVRLAERNEIKPLITRALRVLSKRSRNVLIHRFGLLGRKQRSLQWVGRRLRLTREGVRLIQKNALTRLALSEPGKLLRPYAFDL